MTCTRFLLIIFVFIGSQIRAEQIDHLEVQRRFRGADADPVISIVGESVVVLEYESVYDVHTPPDPEHYPNMRSQPAHFDRSRILDDLATSIEPTTYDFVLLYSIREVPGWIKNGSKYFVAAENIGRPNSRYGDAGHPVWTQLRSVCHMNSVDFLDRANPSFPELDDYGSTLTAIHEMGHFWGVYITRNDTISASDWDSDVHPPGYLASAGAHWMGIWDTRGLPGILLTGANGIRFNAWDLYLMGLLDYKQASPHTYSITRRGTSYTISLDDLIDALAMAGKDYYKKEGKRYPALDPTAKKLRTLVVIVKGGDEELSDAQQDQILDLAETLPDHWYRATWELSKMSVDADLIVRDSLDQVQAGIDYGYWFDRENVRWQEFIPEFPVLTAVDVYIKRAGHPGDLSIGIQSADGDLINTVTVDESVVPEAGWVKAEFDEPFPVQLGAVYRIVVSGTAQSDSPEHRYTWMGTKTSVYNPTCKSSVDGRMPGFDFAFKTAGYETSVKVADDETQHPTQAVLAQNFPNPFNASTVIEYQLYRDSHVELRVFNILGEEIQTLRDSYQVPGTYRVRFEAEHVANGLYFYRLKTKTATIVKKMLYAK